MFKNSSIISTSPEIMGGTLSVISYQLSVVKMEKLCMFKNSSIISTSPEIMGGTPVFAGTRVPVETLFDY
ncbi:DUF433 domain-containing protein [Okeania sp. SIO1I7]|uniref:DUF433 domain-containing protein n=1 Tax=Okeania sp. SIO1I7 TaxID=2607772 RepID=UPI0025F7B2DE|nr:DUF433 domain-containing protein [Okeania sp. SIO1I7]